MRASPAESALWKPKFRDSSTSRKRGSRTAAAPCAIGGDILVKLRTAYQRDGRLAAAATLRQQDGSLSMTDALWTVDRALGLRKPAAFY